MNVVSSHEMSRANCLNVEAYTEVRHDPWQKVCNLFVVVCTLFKSLKEPKFSRNASKLFRRRN
jgi:hypothetical protein